MLAATAAHHDRTRLRGQDPQQMALDTLPVTDKPALMAQCAHRVTDTTMAVHAALEVSGRHSPRPWVRWVEPRFLSDLLQPTAALVAPLDALAPGIAATPPTAAAPLVDEPRCGRLRIRPQALWTGGETLSAAQRSRIAQGLGCAVRNGCSASGLLPIAWACAQGQLQVACQCRLGDPGTGRCCALPAADGSPAYRPAAQRRPCLSDRHPPSSVMAGPARASLDFTQRQTAPPTEPATLTTTLPDRPHPLPHRADRRPLITVAACLLWLSGCAGAPRSTPAAPDAPPAWSTAAPDTAARPARPLEAAWWSRFGDPLLTDLVSQALQANTSVQSAQAALRQARALRTVAAAGLGPTLGSSASAQRSAAGGHDAGSRFQLGLDANWELDVFGARRSALDASDASARASQASLADVQVSIAAEVALGYIGLRGAQARQQIAEDNLASQLETLQITRWRLQAGLVGALEVEQALTAAEQTRATLPPLRTNIAQSGHALAVLTGQHPGALSARLAAPQPVPQPAADLLLSLPAETLRQRPDVRAAEWRLQAEVARLAQADAARLPAFNLGGSLGLSALTLGALSNGASVVGALLAGVTLPVFDGGALRAQVDAQQAVLDQSVAAYRASVLGALQEVEDALVALQGDRARAERLQAAAQSAGNAALMASQRYSSGLVDFQVVLDTQRSQLVTQESLAIAASTLAADHVRLYKALGGGWRADTTAANSRYDESADRPTATPTDTPTAPRNPTP